MADGVMTSRTLLDFYIQRIEQLNPAINAIVANNYPEARSRADAADAARLKGETWGPLHGLPLTVKDTFEVAGMLSTAGAKRLAAHRPERSAIAVQSLHDAGAIVFGKTNTPVYASDLQSYNPVYGTTHNPWNTEFTPGGSSGGSAAALAAGFTAVELGSDIAGSIRTPAHFCGVYGHKASQGIVPMQGHIPGPPGTLSEADLAVAGPMARSAGDLRLLLDVIAGPSPLMSPGWQLTLPESRHQRLSDFKVLLWVDDPFCEIDFAMRASFRQLKESLISQGVQVSEGAPLGKGLDTYFPGYMNLLGSAMGGSSKKRERQVMGLIAPLANKFKDHIDIANTFEQFLKGVSQSHVEWMGVNERRYRLRQRFIKAFDEFDVILTPVAMSSAFKHQHKPEIPLRRIKVNGKKRVYADMFKWIAPATLMGLPATSAPMGLAGSMPVNVQILGAPFEDKTTIEFANLLAQAIGGFSKPPGF